MTVMLERYRIRDAEPMDVFALVDISAKIMKETVYAHMTFDKEKTANYLYDAIIKRPGWFLRLISPADSNEIAGGLLCYCEPTLYGPDKLAYDVTVAVAEEHRGRCLRQLIAVIEEYKAWAEKEGAKLIRMGVSSGLNIDKADGFFEKLGFERVGALYAIRLGV